MPFHGSNTGSNPVGDANKIEEVKNALHLSAFVSADTIVEGLCAFQPEAVAILAGRLMLKRMKQLADEKVDFAFETTLASRTFYPWISRLKKDGYTFHLTFLWLENADLAVSCVMKRIKMSYFLSPMHRKILRFFRIRKIRRSLFCFFCFYLFVYSLTYPAK